VVTPLAWDVLLERAGVVRWMVLSGGVPRCPESRVFPPPTPVPVRGVGPASAHPPTEGRFLAPPSISAREDRPSLAAAAYACNDTHHSSGLSETRAKRKQGSAHVRHQNLAQGENPTDGPLHIEMPPSAVDQPATGGIAQQGLQQRRKGQRPSSRVKASLSSRGRSALD